MRRRTCEGPPLLRIQLDDQLLLHGEVDLLACRDGADLCRHLGGVERQPLGHAAALHFFHRMDDRGVLAAALSHRHHVARLDRERRDVHLAAVHGEVAVAYELARLRPRRREAQAIGDVVQPPLEQLQQRLAGDAAGPLRLLEVAAELVLEDAIDALDLLLLAKLHTVSGQLGLAGLAVLTGGEVALLDRALLRVAALALEEQFHPLAAAEAADRSDITSHSVNPFQSSINALYAPPLRGAAAVVRNRGDVADRLHLDADRLQRADRRLPAGPWALDTHLDTAQAVGLGGVAGADRRLRGGKRRPLARTLEANPAGARPRDHVPLGISDRDVRVVERGVNV